MNGTNAAIPVLSDGRVVLRPPRTADTAALIAGRDADFHRFLGPGSDDPRPTACIDTDGQLAGWIDADPEPDWLAPGEVNVGYHLFADQRGRGLATRAVQLLVHHLAVQGQRSHAALLIRKDNAASLRLAERAGFDRVAMIADSVRFTRRVPPLTYHDGSVPIRAQEPGDVDADLAAKDDEQMRWLCRSTSDVRHHRPCWPICGPPVAREMKPHDAVSHSHGLTPPRAAEYLDIHQII